MTAIDILNATAPANGRRSLAFAVAVFAIGELILWTVAQEASFRL